MIICCLPLEIWARIVAYLNYRDFMAIARTCKDNYNLFQLANSTELGIYHYHLGQILYKLTGNIFLARTLFSRPIEKVVAYHSSLVGDWYQLDYHDGYDQLLLCGPNLYFIRNYNLEYMVYNLSQKTITYKQQVITMVEKDGYWLWSGNSYYPILLYQLQMNLFYYRTIINQYKVVNNKLMITELGMEFDLISSLDLTSKGLEIGN